MMLPEHLLYVVFALSVSSKNNLDSFLTSFYFFCDSSEFPFSPNNSASKHALSDQAGALPGSKTWFCSHIKGTQM